MLEKIRESPWLRRYDSKLITVGKKKPIMGPEDQGDREQTHLLSLTLFIVLYHDPEHRVESCNWRGSSPSRHTYSLSFRTVTSPLAHTVIAPLGQGWLFNWFCSPWSLSMRLLGLTEKHRERAESFHLATNFLMKSQPMTMFAPRVDPNRDHHFTVTVGSHFCSQNIWYQGQFL